MIRFFVFLFVLALIGVGGALFGLWHYSKGLPEHRQLADYDPPTVTRVHAADGRLLAEFATEKRVFVPIEAIPKRVIDAFLAAEDADFYEHPGVNPLSIARAALQNLKNLGKDRRPVGASTITQQVAKNFLLTNEVSIERKIKEALLAFRIEKAFTKERILELYMNEIYLGLGSYGAAAAALNYFDKPLAALTLAEAAYLAALPKAPNNYHPTRRYAAAIDRRNWVIDRMLEEGLIDDESATEAKLEPLETRGRAETQSASAPYFAEEVRRELIGRFGESGLYGGGLSVRTTLDPALQEIADRVLRAGLITYDRRHGWRGPLATIALGPDWSERLAAVGPPPGLAPWRMAVVLDVDEKSARIGLAAEASVGDPKVANPAVADGDGADSEVADGGGAQGEGTIPFSEARWARAWLEDQRFGNAPRKLTDVLAVGDVVAVEAVTEDDDGKAYPEGTYALRQIPDVQGALVALDPHTGRILAMSGGWSQEGSEFNRATQAMRQPGSAFKPIVYLTALDNGFTPSSIIVDGPFVIDQGAGLGKWKPSNYSNKFYGPSTMRLGLEKSRNLMTVRLAQHIGMDKVAETAERLGVVDDLPEHLSLALGAGETTVLRLTTAYAMLVNGGKRITPTLIDRVQDHNGETVYRHDQRPCDGCAATAWHDQPVPFVPDTREQVVDPISAYQVVSMLEGVVQRGTGVRVAAVGKPLAGKTGTTNESFDTWFVGFAPDLAVGVFVGFDQPKTLGAKETGSSAAAPIFRDFMAEALADRPAIPFRVPPGVRLVRVNRETGVPAGPGDSKVILEAFKPGTVPARGSAQTVYDGSGYDDSAYGGGSGGSSPAVRPAETAVGTGGLY
ncbi:MAG: penicillin-binding protein 1A [Rhodospirillaceae bacterium]|nr:penicillin-binding protein 1A [Rhodospirillaceae bacterium]